MLVLEVNVGNDRECYRRLPVGSSFHCHHLLVHEPTTGGRQDVKLHDEEVKSLVTAWRLQTSSS